MRILSPLMSIARGSVAGLTFTANQFHQIVVRQKTAPVNPKTTFQEQMRVAFAAASVHWKGLVQSVRDDWSDYAKTVDYPGPLGSYVVTGRNIFMANAAMILYINARALDTLTLSTAAPTIPGVPSWSDVSTDAPSVPGTGFSIHLENISGDDMNYFITISPPQAPSRLRYKGPWDSSSAVSDTVASLAAVSIDFLTLQEGAAYFARIKGITVEAPHRSSFDIIVRRIAVETVI